MSWLSYGHVINATIIFQLPTKYISTAKFSNKMYGSIINGLYHMKMSFMAWVYISMHSYTVKLEVADQERDQVVQGNHRSPPPPPFLNIL